MKRALVLSRPLVNAGDFLFAERSLEVICANLPGVEIVSGHLLAEYELEWLNGFDVIFITGGPIYDNRFFADGAIPFLKYLDSLKPVIHIFAGGWYGKSDNLSEIYGYSFSPEVLAVLQQFEARGGTFSCRDYITERVLRNNGLQNVTMTGCSAWFFLPMMEKAFSCCLSQPADVHKLVISDQGMTKDSRWHEVKLVQTKNLISHLRQIFPEAEILFTFNGGIDTKYSGQFNRRVCDWLDERGISYVDMSGSAERFNVYDDVDLHIGYRVHSHIYCLAQRLPSVLLEEDARGAGVNQALGLRDIRNYSVNEQDVFQPNPYLLTELDAYLQEMYREKFSRIKAACMRVTDVYEHVVQPYFRKIAGR